MLSTNEQVKMQEIETRLLSLRDSLNHQIIPTLEDTKSWFSVLNKIKTIQGNFNNDVGFVATILAKNYLARKYGFSGFDASEKPQGAPGIDIDVILPDGTRLVAEIKTTSPYKGSDLGANQKSTFEADFLKLQNADARIKLFLVTESATYEIMKKSKYRNLLRNVEVVLLTTEESFIA